MVQPFESLSLNLFLITFFVVEGIGGGGFIG